MRACSLTCVLRLRGTGGTHVRAAAGHGVGLAERAVGRAPAAVRAAATLGALRRVRHTCTTNGTTGLV